MDKPLQYILQWKEYHKNIIINIRKRRRSKDNVSNISKIRINDRVNKGNKKINIVNNIVNLKSHK